MRNRDALDEARENGLCRSRAVKLTQEDDDRLAAYMAAHDVTASTVLRAALRVFMSREEGAQ